MGIEIGVNNESKKSDKRLDTIGYTILGTVFAGLFALSVVKSCPYKSDISEQTKCVEEYSLGKSLDKELMPLLVQPLPLEKLEPINVFEIYDLNDSVKVLKPKYEKPLRK